jgi:hypothetical protein
MRRTALVSSLLGLIGVIGALVAFRIGRATTFFAQPGALGDVLKLTAVLIAYAVAVISVEHTDRTLWSSVRGTAFAFGVATGIIEILTIAVENGLLIAPHGAPVPVAAMLAVFVTWGAAGLWTTRRLRSARGGVLTAIGSSMICMLIAVTGGMVIQLWVAPADPATVVTWAEFKRSGWNDPAEFLVANTLDAGFSHLLLAPMVAAVFGTIGSMLGRLSWREDSHAHSQAS